MDGPISLHVRTNLQLACITSALLSTLRTPKIIYYDGEDVTRFLALVSRAENATSLPTPSEQCIVADFGNGRLVAYENSDRYFEAYRPTVMPCTNTVSPSPKELTEEEISDIRIRHEDMCKKIVENYVSRVNLSIMMSNLGHIYNKVVMSVDGIALPDSLRKEIHHFVRLVYYKCSLVPLRDSGHLSKIYSIMTTFDEAETDDTRGLLTQMSSASPMLLTLTRVQRRTHDKEYVLHCLATLASLKFDQDGANDAYT